MKDPGCLLLSSVSIFYLSLTKFDQAESQKCFQLFDEYRIAEQNNGKASTDLWFRNMDNEKA